MKEYIEEINHLRSLGYNDSFIAERIQEELHDIAVDYGVLDGYVKEGDPDENWREGALDAVNKAKDLLGEFIPEKLSFVDVDNFIEKLEKYIGR